MLTRLKVSGFKNLVDVDVSFGPFTCIAGANGVGKSNLFDAIRFLGLTAEGTFAAAAKAMRGNDRIPTRAEDLFLRLGPGQHAEKLEFAAEVVLPLGARDEVEEFVVGNWAGVDYRLALSAEREAAEIVRLRLEDERLQGIESERIIDRIHQGESETWLGSLDLNRRGNPNRAVVIRSAREPFATEESESVRTYVSAHGPSFLRFNDAPLADDGRDWMPYGVFRPDMPCTVLSTSSSRETATALLTRRELQSWRVFHFEPAAMRKPDEFEEFPSVASDGRGLPSALDRILRRPGVDPAAARQQIVNRAARVVEGLRSIDVDRDPKRLTLELRVTDRTGAEYSARELSDGTLRVLAMAILALDPASPRLLCIEEPENGVHPGNLPGILALLRDLAFDPEFPLDRFGHWGLPDNPLRQVVINTHSPVVVGLCARDDLLIAEPVEKPFGERRVRTVRFGWLADTWRAKERPEQRPVAPGRLLEYLDPFAAPRAEAEEARADAGPPPAAVVDLPGMPTTFEPPVAP